MAQLGSIRQVVRWRASAPQVRLAFLFCEGQLSGEGPEMEQEQKIKVGIRQIYRQIRDEFARMPRHVLYRPEVLGGEVGAAILYTPARCRPHLLVVGNFASSFGDAEANRTVLSAVEPPSFNSYIDQSHRFGEALLSHFDRAGRRNILESCVGTNIWHFQCLSESWLDSAPCVNQIKQFCEGKTREIIQLLKPRVILAVGWGPFKALVGNNVAKGKAVRSGSHRVYDEGMHSITRVLGVPSVTSAYPHASVGDIEDGFTTAIARIAAMQAQSPS